MRKLIILLLLAPACAGRAHPTTLSSINTTYNCNGRQINHTVGRLQLADAQLAVGWRDDDGNHYVSWPTRTTTMETVEYVIPSDTRMDAVERVYDTSQGTSRVDWRMVQQRFCTANGGYSDALARFAQGKTFDQVARDLSLSSQREARDLVHDALQSVQKRYYKEQYTR